MAKKTTCPITRAQFREKAKPVKVAFGASLLAGAACLAAAALFRSGRLGLLYLLAALAALGAGYHCWRCRLVRADDLAQFAGREPAPARLRGVIAEGPRRLPAPSRPDD